MSSDNTTPRPLHLTLGGVDHTARPTWKLRETLEFYRDKLGLPLIHVISARGWGPATHPDFLHFFFDSGNGSTIAFFYYLGSDQPASLDGRERLAPVPEDHVFDATHTAWQVDTAEDLHAWKLRLESRGLTVSAETRHEVIESIYVRDPNGYFIEFTRKLRALNALDATDGELTLQAALKAEDTARSESRRVTAIDEVWSLKAALLDSASGHSGEGLSIYVPCVDEFATLVRAASENADCTVTRVGGYDRIDAERPIEFRRTDLGLKPAVWYGLFTGGLRGTIETLDRDRVRIAPPRAAA